MNSLCFNRQLPFYPTYEVEVCGQVTIWWFIKEFSQCRYNYKNIPRESNACTIITVLLAAHFHSYKIEISPSFEFALATDIVFAFAECILEGNKIHRKLQRSGALRHINLTIPEAIDSTGSRLRHVHEWKFVLYMTDLGKTLYRNFRQHLEEWYQTSLYKEHPDLYIILIADHRSVLFVYQDETDLISLLDSHQHQRHGAFIAQVPRKRLAAICGWYSRMIAEYFNSKPHCYELSFLYFEKSKSKSMKS